MHLMLTTLPPHPAWFPPKRGLACSATLHHTPVGPSVCTEAMPTIPSKSPRILAGVLCSTFLVDCVIVTSASEPLLMIECDKEPCCDSDHAGAGRHAALLACVKALARESLSGKEKRSTRVRSGFTVCNCVCRPAASCDLCGRAAAALRLPPARALFPNQVSLSPLSLSLRPPGSPPRPPAPPGRADLRIGRG